VAYSLGGVFLEEVAAAWERGELGFEVVEAEVVVLTVVATRIHPRVRRFVVLR